MDELSFRGLSLVAVATLLLAFLIKRRALASEDTTAVAAAKQPPGPWSLPVIGGLHHLVGELPHRALLRLSRRHGPLMLVRLGEVRAFVVSSPEAAMEVMKARDPAFASRPRGAMLDIVSCGGKGVIVAPYGEHWRQMRKVCVVELLSARQVKRMEAIRQAEVARLVQSVSAAAAKASSTRGGGAAAVVNLSHALMEFTNDIIAKAVFGGRFRRQEEYLRELGRQVILTGGFNLPDLFPSSRLVRLLSSAERDLKSSRVRGEAIVDGVIRERKEKRRSSAGSGAEEEDLLDVLLRLQEEDALTFPITAEIICIVIYDIFGAATDTTAHTLEWTMAELMRTPQAMMKAKLEVRQKLGHGRSVITNGDLGELHYLRMVIKESLRLHPPVPIIHRGSQESCEIMGYNIPKGSMVSINAFAVARDPRYWDDPDEFKPERFENSNVDYKGTHFELIPFGAGRRICPGLLFATTTIELTLANLLYHFDWVLPDGASPATLDMGEVFGITLSRRSDLHLQATPYLRL
ncbi:hypothetical protein ACP70R_014377 [Stipagrostis hirtigluma subsp. patula]